jgi:Ala-tRNA(Pro) deacylase
MAMLKTLETYLNQNKVKYQVLSHSVAYTAQEIAALEHVPGRKMAKVVMVKKDGRSVMAVLPSIYRVDLERLNKILGGTVELETEREFKGLFSGCETGAEPPFGNLFDVDVWVDTTLTENDDIVFNAGTHKDTVRMRYEDFARLVKPTVAEFSHH